ncbi:MAG: protein-methionine-sulfoxide reductase catalytic subunit MsrP [Acidobacteria bacterium]|nr:protein-methionine-sulfoxide reductase catalytic subunit MsrP [Acidobacteriota bacterium]
MLIKRPSPIRSAEITSKRDYLSRRAFLKTSGLTAAALAGAGIALDGEGAPGAQEAPHGRALAGVQRSPLSIADKPSTWRQITTYNNFYEFGVDKESPARFAKGLNTANWKVTIDGECGRTGALDLEDILKGETLEERIYRLRCVEAWSMVIPWVGFPLANLIRKCEPTSRAKYVQFTTLDDPRQMPGVRSAVLDWPYVEGLRMDEAMHPLAILAVGLYGEVLPNQNGAPLRLVVPWKYGFKGAKSIVKISFVGQQPRTSWMKAEPTWYGFYSNVNPNVSPQRWSQASERVIGGGFFNRKTQMFNGYGDQVAHLYAGMDLEKFF